MYVLVKDCKTGKEAIEKSGMRIGQLMRIKSFHTHGNVEGMWTVIPQIEIMLEDVGTGDILKHSVCEGEKQ